MCNLSSLFDTLTAFLTNLKFENFIFNVDRFMGGFTQGQEDSFVYPGNCVSAIFTLLSFFTIADKRADRC